MKKDIKIEETDEIVHYTSIPLARYNKLPIAVVELGNSCKHSIFKSCTKKCKGKNNASLD